MTFSSFCFSINKGSFIDEETLVIVNPKHRDASTKKRRIAPLIEPIIGLVVFVTNREWWNIFREKFFFAFLLKKHSFDFSKKILKFR